MVGNHVADVLTLRGRRDSPYSSPAKLAEAIRYALSRWEGLTLFVGDGGIELLEAPLP